ncbi:hydroxylysine kinase-like [Haliotis rubra]|uniref:hydroxylysine kinase-like n=1 Tax=Haliotis rubra TaxID=36100 RepID=UPI001EE63609|nr:hydroxylysine kinase-like [Haliotis rubra]
MSDSRRPFVTTEQVKDILVSVYHHHPTTITELPSFMDRNFLVESATLDRCVLKVTNPDESTNDGKLKALVDVALVLKNNGFLCPVHLPNIHGNMFTKRGFPVPLQDSPQEDCCVRLLTYLPGEPLDSCLPLHRKETYFMLGVLLAELHDVLKDFPTYCLQVEKDNRWIAENAGILENYLLTTQEDDIRDIARSVLEDFQSNLSAKHGSLQKGVIHGDLNLANIIVKPQLPGSQLVDYREDGKQLFGIIDFNEVCYTYRVADIAQLIFGAMQKSKAGQQEVLRIGGHVISGYLSIRALGASDLEMLYDFMLIYSCQIVVFGEHSIRQQKNGNTYIQGLVDGSKRWLRFLKSVSRKSVCGVWNDILVDYGIHSTHAIQNRSSANDA